MGSRVALVVEKDPEAGELLEIALGAAGFVPFVVESGERALALMAGRVPDVVVLDLRLADVAGEEVLRQMRAEARLAEVPVIVTAEAGAELAEEVRDDAVLVLVRPVAYEVLRRKAAELAQVG